MVAILSSEVYDIVVHDRQLGARFRFNFDDGQSRETSSIRFLLLTDLDAEIVAREPDALARYIQSLKEDAAEIPKQRIEEKFGELLDLAAEGVDVTNPQMNTLRDRLLQLAQHVRDNP